MALLCLVPLAAAAEDYRAEVERWRAQREQRLQRDDGWLTLVGLHWLVPGENRFGTDPDGEVVFPAGTAPARAGSFFLEDGRVRVRAVPGAGVTREGEPVGEMELAPDTSGSPDVLRLGDLSFYVIRRGDRYGIRVKNSKSPARLAFAGLDWFPVDPSYRIEGEFVPYDEPREVPIATVVDIEEKMLALGTVEFELNGRRLSLEPYVSSPDDEELWFIFRDGTNGKETYGAGRYLYTERERDGKVVVDFNYAYNPPCVFTPYATCPLPPRRNALELRIEAGEKMYGAAH